MFRVLRYSHGKIQKLMVLLIGVLYNCWMIHSISVSSDHGIRRKPTLGSVCKCKVVTHGHQQHPYLKSANTLPSFIIVIYFSYCQPLPWDTEESIKFEIDYQCICVSSLCQRDVSRYVLQMAPTTRYTVNVAMRALHPSSV